MYRRNCGDAAFQQNATCRAVGAVFASSTPSRTESHGSFALATSTSTTAVYDTYYYITILHIYEYYYDSTSTSTLAIESSIYMY